MTAPNALTDIIFESIAYDAMEAVFEVFADRFPKVKTGDMSPEAIDRLEEALQETLAEWVKGNQPAKDDNQ